MFIQYKINILNKTIILLTESPNNNIWTWGSDIYIKERNVQKQIYSGYKPDNVWESIIMQIVIVFYVMTEYKFTFREMNLQRNFYVKDVGDFASTVQYWRYKIKDVDFYVPNYGHLLMFDSDYHDLTTKKDHKIIAEIWKDFMKINS